MLRGKDSQHQQIEKTEYLRFKAFMKTFEKKFLLKNTYSEGGKKWCDAKFWKGIGKINVILCFFAIPFNYLLCYGDSGRNIDNVTIN